MSALNDLMANYQHIIDEITVKTGTKGVFDVKVDDTMIYSKHDTGRHAEEGEVLELFKQHIGPDVQTYPDSK